MQPTNVCEATMVQLFRGDFENERLGAESDLFKEEATGIFSGAWALTVPSGFPLRRCWISRHGGVLDIFEWPMVLSAKNKTKERQHSNKRCCKSAHFAYKVGFIQNWSRLFDTIQVLCSKLGTDFQYCPKLKQWYLLMLKDYAIMDNLHSTQASTQNCTKKVCWCKSLLPMTTPGLPTSTTWA